jgi:murein DD-endopeptidase MepM/ murein hydrolase activator NlpD
LTRRSNAGPDHFTLLIVPHTKQEAISLRMPHWALYICILMVVASLGGLVLLVRDYAVARSQLAALRQDRQVEVDRQRAMRETILAQDEQVRSLSAETSRLNDDVHSMESLIGEVRRIVGLDRLASTANASSSITTTANSITATATVTSTTPAVTPGATTTAIPSGFLQEERAAELAYAMGDRQSAPAPSSRSTTASASWGSLGSEDRAATSALASRGASSAAIDSRFQVRAIQTEVIGRLTSLRQLRDAVKDRVSHLDADKRTDAATIEKQLRIYDAAPKLAPIKGPLDITSPFGMRVDPISLWYSSFHEGVDMSAWWGTSVFSTAAGKVTYAGWQGNLGWTIEIQHDLGFQTLYAHNQRLVARLGDLVKAGQVVAYAGDTGRATGPHVHYEIWLDGHQIDPLKYLDVSGGGYLGR